MSEERILEVAYKLFKQKGVRSTRKQDVARGCGVHPRDVGLIFNSRKELVLAVVKHVLNRKADHLLINSALSASAVTELNIFFRFVDDVLAEMGAELLAEIRRYNPLALDQLNELVDIRLIPCLKRNLVRGLREGFYRDDLEIDRYASIYFFIIRKLLELDQEWIETKRAISCVSHIFSQGVLNARGRRV